MEEGEHALYYDKVFTERGFEHAEAMASYCMQVNDSSELFVPSLAHFLNQLQLSENCAWRPIFLPGEELSHSAAT